MREGPFDFTMDGVRVPDVSPHRRIATWIAPDVSPATQANGCRPTPRTCARPRRVVPTNTRASLRRTRRFATLRRRRSDSGSRAREDERDTPNPKSLIGPRAAIHWYGPPSMPHACEVLPPSQNVAISSTVFCLKIKLFFYLTSPLNQSQPFFSPTFSFQPITHLLQSFSPTFLIPVPTLKIFIFWDGGSTLIWTFFAASRLWSPSLPHVCEVSLFIQRLRCDVIIRSNGCQSMMTGNTEVWALGD